MEFDIDDFQDEALSNSPHAQDPATGSEETGYVELANPFALSYFEDGTRRRVQVFRPVDPGRWERLDFSFDGIQADREYLGPVYLDRLSYTDPVRQRIVSDQAEE